MGGHSRAFGSVRNLAPYVGIHVADEKRRFVSDLSYFGRNSQSLICDLGWLLFAPAQSTLTKSILVTWALLSRAWQVAASGFGESRSDMARLNAMLVVHAICIFVSGKASDICRTRGIFERVLDAPGERLTVLDRGSTSRTCVTLCATVLFFIPAL